MAEVQTLIIEGGCTFAFEAVYQQETTPGSGTWAAVDLTGYSARMMIKLTHDSASPLISLTSTPAAGITITAASGLVAIEMTPTETAAIETAMVAALAAGTISELRAVADCELQSSGGKVYRLFAAEVLLQREVTK